MNTESTKKESQKILALGLTKFYKIWKDYYSGVYS